MHRSRRLLCNLFMFELLAFGPKVSIFRLRSINHLTRRYHLQITPNLDHLFLEISSVRLLPAPRIRRQHFQSSLTNFRALNPDPYLYKTKFHLLPIRKAQD